MTAALLLSLCLLASPDAVIDDFDGPVAWSPTPGGGPPVVAVEDTEHVAAGSAAMRVKYTSGDPAYSNLGRSATVPPDAVAIAVSLYVYSAQPKSAMHFWLFEADGDGWIAPVLPSGESLAELSPGWHEVVVPIERFTYQPRGDGTRKMTSTKQILLGCNYASFDVTLDRLRFLLDEKHEPRESVGAGQGIAPEEGPLGSIAVLADDLPGSPGAADTAVVAKMARELGYGVTLLTADQASSQSVLDADTFDTLVVPCGPAYPRVGRQALVHFASNGGSLVLFGGYAFDDPVVRTSDGWSKSDLNVRAEQTDRPRSVPPPINTRFGVRGDTMRFDSTQLAVFNPAYHLQDVAKAVAAPGQTLLADSIQVEGPLEGYAACVASGNNNPVFHEAHARWVPLLVAEDSMGRPRGTVLGVAHHWRGPFAGSSWALMGVTNRDLVGDDPAGPALLAAALKAVAGPAFLSDARTEWACYHEGEAVQAAVEVYNHARHDRKLAVRFRCGDAEAVTREVNVPSGETLTVEAAVHAGDFDNDFYKLTVELVDETLVDELSTGFVVWNDEVIASGPEIRFEDNYFTFDGQPRFVCGSNQTGMMLHGNQENPLVWRDDLEQMQSNGMRMLRVLHFSPFAADDPIRWRPEGVDVLKGRPERLLRKTDAIVQLAQKHRVSLFLTLHDWMPVELSDAELELQREWARFWAHRYRDVPGILYDVQNEPNVGGQRAQVDAGDWTDLELVAAERHRVEMLNRWVQANAEGIRQGDPDALTTVGYLEMMYPADKLLGARHVDFSNMHYHSSLSGFPGEFKLIDRRFEGKGLSLGEFGAREQHDARTAGRDGEQFEESITRFLMMSHDTLGMGGSCMLNWDWKDFDGCVFPWGLVHQNDGVAKRLLPAYRNLSLFFERLRPQYEDPGLYLVLPDANRLGPKANVIHRGLVRATDALLANHVDFNVANEDDLDQLPDTCRAIVWPVPYCPTDEAFEQIVQFVRDGGSLYLSGDVAYDSERLRTKTDRWAKLGLRDPGERSPVEQAMAEFDPQSIQRGRVGQGATFFVPSAVELSDDGLLTSIYRQFLEFAAVERIAIEPDLPDIRVYTLPLEDGQATVVVNRTGKNQQIRLGKSQLLIGPDRTGLIARNASGAVTAIECTGSSQVDGEPFTTGSAHVMLASLDNTDIRRSKRLIVYPITAGSLAIHAHAEWRDPIMEVGQFAGPTWQPLREHRLLPDQGRIVLGMEEELARSVLVVREATDEEVDLDDPF